jgi:hypothetical protein
MSKSMRASMLRRVALWRERKKTKERKEQPRHSGVEKAVVVWSSRWAVRLPLPALFVDD